MWGLLIIESPIEKIQFFIKEFEEMKKMEERINSGDMN